jgi:hypothetical protein
MIKPTLKAIHICNYSRILNFILEFVNFVSHQPTHNPKIAKEYVFANADRRTKKNTERTTACIRNSGVSAKLRLSTFNESQCQTESEVLLNPLLLIHANR